MEMAKIINYKTIQLKEINLRDTTFSFSFPESCKSIKGQDALKDSIRRMGVIHPVILYQNRIVCGRRRVLACRALGKKLIPAGVIEGKISPNFVPAKKLRDVSGLDLFILNIEDNLYIRQLNIIENAVIIEKLIELWQADKRDVITKYLPLLHIPSDIRYLQKYRLLAKLNNKVKSLIVERGISLDTVDIIRQWPIKVRNNVLSRILAFGFGNNKISRILTLLNDISVRDNVSADSIFKVRKWLNVSRKRNIPLYRKGIWLTNFLEQKLYPMRTEFRAGVKSIIARLNLAENISVEMDNLLTGEDNNINLKIKCGNRKELEGIIAGLRILKSSKALDELLHLIKGH